MVRDAWQGGRVVGGTHVGVYRESKGMKERRGRKSDIRASYVYY